MTLWVADASVVCKWHFEEDNSSLARAFLARGDEIVAPDFLLLEFANAVSRKIRMGEFPAESAGEAMELAVKQITRIVPALGLVSSALEMSAALRHPIYDCLYLALAEREGAMLVTDDQIFFRKAAASRWRKYAASLRDFAPDKEQR